MFAECNQQSFESHAIGRRNVIARFDGGRITSDGVGLLLREAEQCNVGFDNVAQPLRVALSGTTLNPSITDTLLPPGNDRTMTRIGRALSVVGSYWGEPCP